MESAMYHVRLLEKHDFNNIVISIKSSNVPRMMAAYRLLSQQCDYPLHVGVTEAGTYYFRYEVKDCGFANGYYWINMNKVGGGLKQTDTTHAQAKIYDANKKLIKTGMDTRAAGQFGAVETSSDTPEIVRELMENGVMSLDFLLNNKKMWFIGHFRTDFMQKRD